MQKLLPSATLAQVAAEVRRYCRVLGKGGGYILSPAHLFQPDVSPENVLAEYIKLDHNADSRLPRRLSFSEGCSAPQGIVGIYCSFAL